MNNLIKITGNCVTLLFLSLGIVSCSESSDETQHIEFVSKSNSGCKNTVEKNRMQFKNRLPSECIKCKALDNGVLLITHANADFSCEQESILTSVEIKENTVIVTEKQELSKTNCICFYDMYYTMSGLIQGKKYSVIITNGKYDIGRLTFVYNSSLETIKDIEK